MNHLRVWEETWAYVHSATAPRVDTHLGGHINADKVGPHEEARLRLAAKAPEMVRTLMVMAGMGSDPYCNGCGDTSKNGHARGCALVKLLFEAGVGDVKQSDRSAILRLVSP